MKREAIAAVLSIWLAGASAFAADNGNGAEQVEIEWRGQWYPGTVMHRKCGLTKVHYTGYDNGWDEWVETPRLRAPTGTPAPRSAPRSE